MGDLPEIPLLEIGAGGGRAIYAASPERARALIAWFKEGASPPDYPTPRSPDPDAQAGLTVFGWGRPVVRFEDGPYPILMEGSCYAVGSGSLFAHGAMRAGASAATAASLAAQYVEYCGGEIDVVDLKELTDDAAR